MKSREYNTKDPKSGNELKLKQLFSSKQPQDGFERSFLSLLTELEKETTERLDITISVNEIEEAIDNLNNGKSSEPDGLGAAFYKLFSMMWR